jgi:BirA family biotin operon repressor/biotin-[acetyl-CoA-carboxylase] ligase
MEKDYRLQIHFFDELDSTQLYLKRLIQEGKLISNTMVCAHKQTNGIGSRENSWQGIQGNLFFSFAIDKNQLPNDLPLASASIYYSYLLKEILTLEGSKVWIKWPNDFYIDEKKIGGTITNIYGDYIVCGIGLNLFHAPSEFAKLDIIIDKKELLEKYKKTIEKKILWKQVFSKYKLEFDRNKDFFTHHNGKKVSLESAKLEDDGSLSINGERMYSLR